MSNISYDIIENNLVDPAKFTREVQTLNEQLPSILADFKKYYVFYNKNPEYNEYQQLFENIKSNLNKINSQLFTIGNDVQVETNKLSKSMIKLDELIQNDKKTNTTFKNKLKTLKEKNSSAYELIYDYNTLYDIKYLKNWAMFLNIIIAGFILSYVFKVKPQIK
jgi:DNA repair ATPase RecN